MHGLTVAGGVGPVHRGGGEVGTPAVGPASRTLPVPTLPVPLATPLTTLVVSTAVDGGCTAATEVAAPAVGARFGACSPAVDQEGTPIPTDIDVPFYVSGHGAD